MDTLAAPSNVERNVRLYPWYALSLNALFWMPVFVLYFLEHMPLADVLRLEAIYYGSVVLLELPSGYFSDRVGRRPTLLIATASLVAAYIVFAAADAFAGFAVGQVLLAVGLAFNSGTDTSLHYDSLESLGRTSEYAAREGIAVRNAMLAAGLSGIVGGAAALLDLRYAYVLSAVGAALSLVLVGAMVEPPKHVHRLLPDGPLRQLRSCRGLLADRVLGWTFAYAVAMTVLNHVPYEFYQPYIAGMLDETELWEGGAPLVAGVHLGAAMLLASASASMSIALRDRLGYVATLLVGTGLQVAIILGMAIVVHPAMLLLVLLRSVPRAITTAPMNAAIAPRVEQHRRATYLSLQSLAGRFGFAAFLLGLSWVSPPDPSAGAWSAITWRLAISAALGGLVLVALAATAPRRRSGIS